VELSGKRFSLVSWNINGDLSKINLCHETLRFLSDFDLIAFSHTGLRASDHVPVLDGFRNLSACARPYDPSSGGVAIYAKSLLNASVVQDIPEFGMSWVRLDVARKLIYACVCYMPHGESSYFGHENGDLNARHHWECLQSGIAKYQKLGEIIIMGDLNARTGQLDDRFDDDDMKEWEVLTEAGLPVASNMVQMHAHMRRFQCRVSADDCVNSHGKHLVHLCKNHGLLIMNGRLPGDRHGSFTYFHGGKKEGRRSTIDYFIASPGIVYDSNFTIRGTSDLCIHDISSLPRRFSGGKYDHLPVMLYIDVDNMAVQQNKAKEIPDHNYVSYKWDSSFREQYADILLTDGGVLGHFQSMYQGSDVDCVEREFSLAVEHAIHCVHALGGNTIQHKKKRLASCDRPCNAWYNDACKAARRALIQARRAWGPSSKEAIAAQRMYRRVTQAAKRVWENDKHSSLLNDVRRDPKRFWGKYHCNKKGSSFDVSAWSVYFKNLFSADGVGRNVSHDDNINKIMFPNPSDGDMEKAVCLNEAFSEAEIIQVLGTALNGKSAGYDGIPVEFYKNAYVESINDGKTSKSNILIKQITHVFNMVLEKGYPKRWAIGNIVPVPKSKGNPDVQDDYRGITVGSSIAKLYSIAMLQRMDKWAEVNNLRAKGQAGFRSGRGTPDNAFILNHIIEKYRSQKKLVYAAFIDFRKAYDCISRPLLWQCMRSFGLHGSFLNSLISMYENVQICVRVDGELGDCFNSEIGVKQGDPLSPLLFGLFIDRFEKVIDRLLCSESGVQLGLSRLKILLYADDLVLMADSSAELQDMLNTLGIFCCYNAMTVNIKKSEVVVFNNDCSESYNTCRVTYDGMDMVVKSKFIYLGMLFDEVNINGKNPSKASSRCLDKGKHAMYALIRRCHEMDIHNVYIKTRLFDTLVKPIIYYGCEVWCPYSLPKGDHLTESGHSFNMENLHKNFLRQCLGIRQSVPDIVVMNELQREPLIFGMVKQLLGFWNRIQKRPDSDLVKIALLESWDLAKRFMKRKLSWVAQLYGFLSKFGCNILLGDNIQPIKIAEVLDNMTLSWKSSLCRKYPDIMLVDGMFHCARVVRSIPDGESDGFKAITYFRWFANSVADKWSTFWFHLNRFDQITTTARFRMGSHWLNSEMGRFRNNMVPRSQRICTCCCLHDREDEVHILICPFYNNIRSMFVELLCFPSNTDVDLSMNQCMNNFVNYKNFWHNMSNFLIRCKTQRENHINFSNG
jgi:exonuclease III